MSQLIADAVAFLQNQSLAGYLALFWFVLLFEVPRYILSLAMSVFVILPKRIRQTEAKTGETVTVIIAGHNEENSIECCVKSLWEQSAPPDEIIVVSDGSSDHMAAKLRELQGKGLIHKALGTELRAGKAAATNLAERCSSGNILVNVDCDCSFDRHALKNIVAPFDNPDVGAVSGNIIIRNPARSVWTSFQAIEYLISISLGKRLHDLLGQVSCASGAFSAFRATALRGVGGLDAGGGEDLDVTLRLRKAGWDIAFAADAICHTDPPATVAALIRQRFRWERDAVRLRFRKHFSIMNPMSSEFRMGELVHELEFLIVNVIAALLLPIYWIWLFSFYGDLAIPILIGAQLGLTLFDAIIFCLAAFLTPQANALPLVPFLVGYSTLYSLFNRIIRIIAYLQEWIFRASYADPYVPDKVHNVRE